MFIYDTKLPFEVQITRPDMKYYLLLDRQLKGCSSGLKQAAVYIRQSFMINNPTFHDIFMRLGISKEPINFLVDKSVARGTVEFIQFWMWYGYTMIILVSGVMGINPELFESAEVDGANRIQTFFYITNLTLQTILLFTLVTSLIGGLQMFDIPKLFLMGGPDNATLTTSVFIYNQAFSGSYMYNRAAAASMIMFIIICAASAVLFFLMRDKDEALLNKQKRRQEKEYRKALKEGRKS